MRSAHHVFPEPGLVQRNLFCPCVDANPSGYGDKNEMMASVLCKRRLPGPGYPIQIQFESELLSRSTAVHNSDTSWRTDVQDTQAMLSASHLPQALVADGVHDRASPPGRQAFQQYLSPVPPSKQVTSAYYFASPNDNAPSNGAESLPVVGYLDTAMCSTATGSFPSGRYSKSFSSNDYAPSGDRTEDLSSGAYSDQVFCTFTTC